MNLMNLKHLFRYGVLAIAFMGIAVAMDDDQGNNKFILAGCRPGDDNIQGVKGLEKADYLDFNNRGLPNPLPKNFYHIDWNDNGTSDAGKLSEFAKANPETYPLIIIDWATYQHIQ